MDIKKKNLSNEYLYNLMKTPQWNFHVKVIILHEQNHQWEVYSLCEHSKRCVHSKGMDQAGSWVQASVCMWECVCLCYVHVCLAKRWQVWGEGKKMVRLRSRSEDDHKEIMETRKDLSKQFKMVLWLRLRVFTKALCVRLDMWKIFKRMYVLT